MTLSVQIVVIVGSEKRKITMVEQFAELDIPFPVYYLSASIPSNTALYLPDNIEDYRQRHICCSKSHIRAIEYAARQTSSDVTIVMEDDAALHKTKFIPTVLELLKNWDTIMPADSQMLSLGWIPLKNFSFYELAKSEHYLKTVNNIKLLSWFAYGTQAYMVKKTAAQKIYPLINHRTHEELKTYIHSLNNSYIPKDDPIENVDWWMNRLFTQSILFELLVIERREKSIINSPVSNNFQMWDVFFKDYEEQKKNYWSYA